MKLTEKEKIKKEYIDSSFEIRIVKKIGEDSTTQVYFGTQQEIAVGVTSMFEQLLSNKVFTASHLKYMLKLAIQAYEENIEN